MNRHEHLGLIAGLESLKAAHASFHKRLEAVKLEPARKTWALDIAAYMDACLAEFKDIIEKEPMT